MTDLTFNLVVGNAVGALTYLEEVFGGKRLEVYEFSEVSGYNEANIEGGGVTSRLIDANPEFECYPPNKNEVDSI